MCRIRTREWDIPGAGPEAGVGVGVAMGIDAETRRIVLCYVLWDERRGRDGVERTTRGWGRTETERLHNGKGEVVRKRKEER